MHCRGREHQKKLKETKFVPVAGAAPWQADAAPICSDAWAQMRFYAQHGKPDDIEAKLNAGVDPNERKKDDDRTLLFWAAWAGHAKVIARLLQHQRARDLAKRECHGRDGVPEKPKSPMEVAHDKWGKESENFAEFGVLVAKANEGSSDGARVTEAGAA